MSAPASSSIPTLSGVPNADAMCRGVQPSLSRAVAPSLAIMAARICSRVAVCQKSSLQSWTQDCACTLPDNNAVQRLIAEMTLTDLLMYVLLGTMANSANCGKQSQETNLDVQDRDRGEWFSLGHLSWGNRNVLKSHRLYPGPSALQILAGLSFDISCGRHTMSDTSILSHFGL